MALLDSLLGDLLSVRLVNCSGVQVGSTSILSTLTQITVGGILYVSIGNGTMQESGCSSSGGGTGSPGTGTPGTGGGSSGGAVGRILLSAGDNLSMMALGRADQAAPSVYSTGTCTTCRRREQPLTRTGVLAAHRFRPAQPAQCGGTGTLPVEQRGTTQSLALLRERRQQQGLLHTVMP